MDEGKVSLLSVAIHMALVRVIFEFFEFANTTGSNLRRRWNFDRKCMLCTCKWDAKATNRKIFYISAS